jgi:hypothetical protein
MSTHIDADGFRLTHTASPARSLPKKSGLNFTPETPAGKMSDFMKEMLSKYQVKQEPLIDMARKISPIPAEPKETATINWPSAEKNVSFKPQQE